MTLRPRWYGPAPCRNCRADAVPWPVLAGIWALFTSSVASRRKRRRTSFIAAVKTDSSQPSRRTSLIAPVKTDSFKNEKACVSHHNRQDGRFQKDRSRAKWPPARKVRRNPIVQDLRRRQSATARSTLTSPITIGGPSTRIRCDEAIRWFRSLTISRTDSSSGTSAASPQVP